MALSFAPCRTRILAQEAPKLIDDVTESKVARCDQKVGPRAITGGQAFLFAIDTLRSLMSGDGDRRGKSSGSLLLPSLEDSKVMRKAIREGEPSWPLHNEVTDRTGSLARRCNKSKQSVRLDVLALLPPERSLYHHRGLPFSTSRSTNAFAMFSASWSSTLRQQSGSCRRFTSEPYVHIKDVPHHCNMHAQLMLEYFEHPPRNSIHHKTTSDSSRSASSV